MSVTEDVARLKLESQGADALEAEMKDLNEQLGYTRKSLDQVKDAYNAGEIDIKDYAQAARNLIRQEDELILQTNRVAAAQTSLNQAQTVAARTVTTTADVTTAAAAKQAAAIKKSGVDIGNAALQASRGIEDLQYGFHGVVNNIPGVVMALGGTAGLTATISLVSIGINQLINHWDQLTRAFSSTVTIPKVVDDLDGMNNELERAKKRMDELAKSTKVTLDEFEEWNILRAETVQLEKKIAEERERAANLKEFMGLRDKAETDAEKARADMLKQNFGTPKNKELLQSIEKSLPTDQRDALQAVLKKKLENVDLAIKAEIAGRGDVGIAGEMRQQVRRDRIKSAESEAAQALTDLQTENKRMQDEAARIASEAVSGGKLDALRKIQELAAKNAKAFTQAQIDAFEAASPEGMQRAKDFKDKAEADAIRVKEEEKALADKLERDRQNAIDAGFKKAMNRGLQKGVLIPGQNGEPAAGPGGGGPGPGGGGQVNVAPIGAGAALPEAVGGDASAVLPAPIVQTGKSMQGMNRIQRARFRKAAKNAKRKAMLKAKKQAKATRLAKLKALNAKREEARVGARRTGATDKAAMAGPGFVGPPQRGAGPAGGFFAEKEGAPVAVQELSEVIQEAPKLAMQGANAARGAAAITVRSIAVIEQTQQAVGETQRLVGNALDRLARAERASMRLDANNNQLAKGANPPMPNNMPAGR